MKRILSAIVVLSLLCTNVFAVSRKKAIYVGGTVEAMNQFKKGPEGILDWKDEKQVTFQVKEQTIVVPYERIIGLEYQNTRRYRTGLVGGAIGMPVLGVMAAGATMGISLVLIPVAAIGAPFLRKGRKRHFMTVAYTDADGKAQAMILELGKDIEQEARAVLSARSGKEVKMVMEDN